MSNPGNFSSNNREPAFNLPPVIIACVAILLGIHAARIYLLSPEAHFDLIIRFAFIARRVMEPEIVGAMLPGGTAAAWWSFVTYALLHADWSHLIFNSLWLVAFGAPLAWRFGSTRFLLFSASGAIFGALFYLVFNPDQIQPMVGASAAVSAYLAGVVRFALFGRGPFGGFGGPAAYRLPAPPLREILVDRRALTFMGIWFAINLLFGLLGSASGTIAWEAHIGGFLAGLFLFPAFDPVGRV
jgi:membrane associated rhomboid family serine protease